MTSIIASVRACPGGINDLTLVSFDEPLRVRWASPANAMPIGSLDSFCLLVADFDSHLLFARGRGARRKGWPNLSIRLRNRIGGGGLAQMIVRYFSRWALAPVLLTLWVLQA
ncbi:hypothetical protein CA85_49250 [Allorhodopirellula solitaria]|uniref:Uncharacterized protein n=1 Tax=Allorhodopirellula solitaria TaxID=2527987 RepID=A0A5C5WZZ3_9BACT|nr:hypothetical protein CA85_49250 [Allorhodopirellula solitaria]